MSTCVRERERVITSYPVSWLDMCPRGGLGTYDHFSVFHPRVDAFHSHVNLTENIYTIIVIFAPQF